MKKAILILLVVICVGKISNAQNELTETQKLAATAKVWGFLKYYHPRVAAGKYNWDNQLFEILPKIKVATNKEQLSQIYIDWIDQLEKVAPCKKCDQEQDIKYFDKNFDLSWIDNSETFTPELSEKLRYIEKNRHQGKKYYVSSTKKGNIEIKNELDYKGFNWQNENLRLLSFFRYWNIVEYFYPYKYQTDTDWDDVLTDMIPTFLYPKTEMDFHLAMLELVVNLEDSHTGLSTEQVLTFYGNYWIPAGFKIIENKAIITWFYDDSLARINDLKIGDVITKVNGDDIETVFLEKEKYIFGSNTSRKKYNAHRIILNGSSDSVNIEFVRDGNIQSKVIRRYLYEEFNINYPERIPFKILDGNIGYVDMGALKVKEIPEMMDSLMNTKAIIFDLRTYPKAWLYSITNYISSTYYDFYKKISPDLNYPGKFIWEKAEHFYAEDGELEFKGKAILLVNEKSQSFSEFTTMCLQTGDNVTTIGSQTSGADGDTSPIEMVGGYKTPISGIGIFYPDGTETQRKGVKVDIEVKPTIQGIIEGRDEVLERAIQFINEE